MFIELYELLLNVYGPQGWWPLYCSKTKKLQYHPGCYRSLKEKEALEVCIGAILTQNTSWNKVESAIALLHKNKLFSIKKLLSDDFKPDILRCIHSCGYYNQKYVYIKNFLEWYVKEGKHTLPKGRRDTQQIRKSLLAIKGIGRETADSMMLYGYNIPVFVVDSYTKRYFFQTGALDKEEISYDTLRLTVESEFQESFDRKKLHVAYNEFHALIVRHMKNRI